MEITVSVTLNPTEDKEKVIKAVKNIFPDAQLHGEEVLEGSVQDLKKFQELLERRRVRNTFESILIRNYFNGSTYVLLNKQAAFMGKPNIFVGQELGPIKLEIFCDEKEIHSIIWGSE